MCETNGVFVVKECGMWMIGYVWLHLVRLSVGCSLQTIWLWPFQTPISLSVICFFLLDVISFILVSKQGSGRWTAPTGHRWGDTSKCSKVLCTRVMQKPKHPMSLTVNAALDNNIIEFEHDPPRILSPRLLHFARKKLSVNCGLSRGLSMTLNLNFVQTDNVLFRCQFHLTPVHIRILFLFSYFCWLFTNEMRNEQLFENLNHCCSPSFQCKPQWMLKRSCAHYHALLHHVFKYETEKGKHTKKKFFKKLLRMPVTSSTSFICIMPNFVFHY